MNLTIDNRRIKLHDIKFKRRLCRDLYEKYIDHCLFFWIYFGFGRLCLQNFPLKDHEDLFWDDLQNGFSCVFLQTLGAILWNQTRLGTIFARIFRGFAQIFMDFARIFNKWKLLPHHWLAQNFRHNSTDCTYSGV